MPFMSFMQKVRAFLQVNKDVREFSLGASTTADVSGIVFASFLAIYVGSINFSSKEPSLSYIIKSAICSKCKPFTFRPFNKSFLSLTFWHTTMNHVIIISFSKKLFDPRVLFLRKRKTLTRISKKLFPWEEKQDSYSMILLTLWSTWDYLSSNIYIQKERSFYSVASWSFILK